MLEKKSRLNYINSLKEELDRVLPKEKWDNDFKENLKIDFTFYSNKIEGNKINYNDTIKYLREGLVHKREGIKDLADLKNHKVVLDKIFQVYETIEFSVKTIKGIHKELMKDPIQWEGGIIDPIQGPGSYRQEQVGTHTEIGFKEYMKFPEVPRAMEELVKQTNKELKQVNNNVIEKHPLTIATRFHNKFLNEIHPFIDGNGRTGRIFTNIILMQNGFSPLIIKDREAYIRCIRRAEKENSIQPTLLYFCDVLAGNIKSSIQYALNKG